MEQTATNSTTRVLKSFYNREIPIIKKENSSGETAYFPECETEASKELDVFSERILDSFDRVLDGMRAMGKTLEMACLSGCDPSFFYNECVVLFDVLLRDADSYVMQLYHAMGNSGINIEIVRLKDHTSNNASYNDGNQIIDIKVDRAEDTKL